MVGESMLKHNFESDEEEPIGIDDSKEESLDAVEIAELHV